MSIDYKIIGKRIKERRKMYKITQETLAEKLGVSVGYISQIERGIAHANLDTLANISHELNCDVTEFLSNVTANNKNYLNNDFLNLLSTLNDKQKKMLFDIAEIIKQNH